MTTPARHPPSGRAPDHDTALAPMATRRGWQAGTLVPALVAVIVIGWLGFGWVQLEAAGTTSISLDFRVFWAAARLAVLGMPLDAFSVSRLEEMHGTISDVWMPWSYPPAFMVALMPFGWLQFAPALVLYTGVSAIAVLAASRPLSHGILPLWLALALAPAYLPSFLMGQTAVLWTAGLMAALACLGSGRPVLAGVFIGLLTLKPQLGLLIPVALIAAGQWRCIASATVTTVAVSLFATLIVGMEYWSIMVEMMRVHFGTVRDSAAENYLMISPHAAFAGLGLPEPLALKLQWAMTGLAAIAVGIAWASPRIPFDLRAAMLIVGAMLSQPYLWYYESALMVPAALFLVRAGVLRLTHPPGLLLVAAMWLGLGPAMLFQFLSGIDIYFRTISAPILFIALAVTLRALFIRLRGPAARARPSQNDLPQG